MGGAVPPPVAGPPATAPAAAPTPVPAPATEVTVQSLPDRLRDLARTVVLTGTVAGETPEGLTRVRTQAGEILLQTPAPLPADKPVTLQIAPGQTAGSKLLLLLQGATTPPTAGTGSSQAGAVAAPAVILPNLTPPTAPTTQPVAQPLPLLLPGTIVPALVIAAAPKAPAPPGAQPTLPGQTAAAPTPATPTTPPNAPFPPSAVPIPAPAAQGAPATPAPRLPLPTGAGAMPPPPAAPSANPAPAAPFPTGKPMLDVPVQLGGDAAHPGGAEAPRPSPAPPPLLTPGTAPEPDLPQGATVALKILTVTPPSDPSRKTEQPKADPKYSGSPQNGGERAGTQPNPTAPMVAAPMDMGETPFSDAPDTPMLHGTVAGSTPQGQPILATRQGMLALNVQASLPQGATVTAALSDPAAALKGAAPQTPELGPLSERDWPAMRQLLTSLAGVDRAAAQSLLSTVMPQPNRKLGAALSFFLSAIRGGDARAWLGDEATSALDRAGRGDLLQQLDREFKNLQQQASEPLPGDWRPYTLPMFDSNGPTPIRLHIHPIKGDEDGPGKGKAGAKGSRFLLDLELSRLGPMQLDGLVQPNRFDLILRSHTPLAPEFRLDLIQIFADSIRAVGYTGGLSFQSGAKCWVKLTRAGAGSQSYTA